MGEGDDKPALIFMSAERAGEGFDWWPDFFLFFFFASCFSFLGTRCMREFFFFAGIFNLDINVVEAGYWEGKGVMWGLELNGYGEFLAIIFIAGIRV